MQWSIISHFWVMIVRRIILRIMHWIRSIMQENYRKFRTEKLWAYHILPIIHGKNFCCSTSLPSLPKKRLRLPAFIASRVHNNRGCNASWTLDRIHVQKFTKKLSWLWSNPWKTWKFFTANNKQYMVITTTIMFTPLKQSYCYSSLYK